MIIFINLEFNNTIILTYFKVMIRYVRRSVSYNIEWSRTFENILSYISIYLLIDHILLPMYIHNNIIYNMI